MVAAQESPEDPQECGREARRHFQLDVSKVVDVDPLSSPG